MEWAQRITANGRELAAEVATDAGAVELLSLDEMYRRGLPTTAKPTSKKFKVKFGKFLPCDPREYAVHFGIQRPNNRHQVFELSECGVRFLVPALALMRALFRPAPHLLPEMFGPSVLDRTCRVEFVGDVAHVVVDAKWATAGIQMRHSNLVEPISWMRLHPSARRMAASVHQSAMSGRIALSLPEGSAELVLAGIQEESTFFVTRVRILSVVPADGSDFLGAASLPRVNFLEREWAKARNTRQVLSIDVPERSNGSIAVTDDEWAAIGPLLLNQRRNLPQRRHSQRKIFNGVLQKLATGRSWHRCTYEVGDWRNAATAYRTWRTKGGFARAMDKLRTMRGRAR